MEKDITWVGLDAHKKTISVAVLLPKKGEPVEWTTANDPSSVRQLARRLVRFGEGGEVRCCYEAGPCGYALQRQLEAESLVCEVIAPSLIPRKPGDRTKTDRRDARKLAEFLRAGLLTMVHPPTPAQEAMRDLCRCREDAREDLARARHRLQKMLVRRGLVFTATTKLWTKEYRRWLRTLRFDDSTERAVFEDYMVAVEHAYERLKALEAKLLDASQNSPLKEPVAHLRCFRGVDTITAMVFATELHNFQRFDSPRRLAAYLGLVPSVHSSAETTRRGNITKTGNRHVRRVLIEAAWAYRNRPLNTATLRSRRKGQPERIVAIAERAQSRLHRRYERLILHGKPSKKVVIAVARELVGFLWAALTDKGSNTTADG